MNIFYTPHITGETHTLNEEESKHCIRVLRLKIGDNIVLVDGKGGLYHTEIVNAHPKKCEVKVLDIEKEYGRRNFHLHIAVAPTKNIERLEWFLEKATEFGVDEITPLICEHSERKVVNEERLNKILISAMKQSLKAYLPKLNSPVSFKEFIQISPSLRGGQGVCLQKFIAHLSDNSKKLKSVYKTNKNATILIGPEGDFSQQEIDFATKNCFVKVNLGTSRLRTETAAVAACHTFNLMNE